MIDVNELRRGVAFTLDNDLRITSYNVCYTKLLRIHLAEDRIFYYQDRVYSNHEEVDLKIALAFQREVINNIIPTVKPDLRNNFV